MGNVKSVVRLNPRRSRICGLSYKTMHRVLIIRACAIGDFVLNLPALVGVQQKYPNARFTLIGNPSSLEVSREFLAVEKIYSIELQPWCRLFYEPLPQINFDSAIVWMKDPSVAANLRHSGIPDVIRADPFPTYGHAADHLLLTLKLERPRLPDLWARQSDDIIVHAESGSSVKVWPFFEPLIGELPNVVRLLGPSPSGRGQGEGLKACSTPRTSPDALCASASPGEIGVLENLSLVEVLQHLRRCRLYIGNDSGITHLAAYLGCPSIAIFGPTDPRVWGPVGRRSRVIWKRKLEDISVDEVLLAVRAALWNEHPNPN